MPIALFIEAGLQGVFLQIDAASVPCHHLETPIRHCLMRPILLRSDAELGCRVVP